MPQMLFQYTTLKNNPYLARSGLHSNLDDSDSGIYCQLHRWHIYHLKSTGYWNIHSVEEEINGILFNRTQYMHVL